MEFLALQTETENIGFTDELILDEWVIPFGDWIDQSVIWIDQNLAPLLDAFRWPFEFLLDTLVTDVLEQIPWIWVVLAVFLIGSFARNLKVGVGSALALTVCGLLGPAYWDATAKTIGFILVAVILCALIGIPLGVLAGRFDSFWNVVRPLLDAMQVVHSFVYMLPFIFFFGIGEEAATMVTMVFALPPLIRLTNLGIRQVPEDVVEASRAYGATELRVLTDVQLPLARPAIMTGLNQTLLLSISMLGIAAIMGAGGLGALLFRAINNQDVALAASAGLAFFLVAVVLDRISQSESTDAGGLAARIRSAWANLRTPENLLTEAGVTPVDVSTSRGNLAVLSSGEKRGLPISAVGGVIAFVSLFLVWGNESGLISGHVRRTDLDLAGQAFNGFHASGGSWLGYIIGALALYVVYGSISRLRKPASPSRWHSADMSTMFGVGMLGASLAYLLISPNPEAVNYSHGPGVWVALLGSLLVALGGVFALSDAPYSAKTPLPSTVSWARVVGGGIAFLIVIVSLFSGWVFDQRGGASGAIPEEIQIQIDELKAQAVTDPSSASASANKVQSLLNQARNQALSVYDGFNEAGFQLGTPLLVLSILALLALLPASGVVGTGDESRWRWSTIVAALGVAMMVISLGLIASTSRVIEGDVTTGIGLFLALMAGFLFFATSRKVLSNFERSKIYADGETGESIPAEPAPAVAEALV